MMRAVWLSCAAAVFASTAAAQSAITGVVAPPLSPRNASYSIDARLDVREPDDHRLGAHHLAEHHIETGLRSPVSPLLERVEKRAHDVHARARARRRRGAAGT